MHLKRGIHIYSDLPGIDEQLSINNGTMPATIETGLNYHTGSYIPKREWRKLEHAEKKLLITDKKNTDFRKSIYVGDIPQHLKDAFRAMGLHDCTQLDQVYPKMKEDEEAVKTINKDLDIFLRPFSTAKNYKFHRITRAMPNRETITCHYIDEEFIYIGLHIDQSKRFTPHTAHQSGNRISINLSKETRYLAFTNLSLIQVFNMVKEKINLTDTDVNPDNIAYLFFKHYPDYPAIRVDLKPYQYYVAPTDNFFHDATTLGNKEIDITIVYTGIFDMAML
ncbi:hypothetical protein TH53_20030 [Pedobacter lusitanus]|uniref:Uncharacterized protein n=1 Tax=Pedobacter lusitanus TaxID=1503925 RepID=A0A0D0GM78_9SPHI|nr:hypothetical protein [Pedobacter lusitanus]KIO75541.1 hypothetical protein TH53_20030 [Pedobacter lusitanus]